MKRWKQAPNCSGSSSRNTRLKARRAIEYEKFPQEASFSRAKIAMSTAV